MYLKPFASAKTTTTRRHVSRGRRQILIERLESRVLLSGGAITLAGNSANIANAESAPSQSNFTDFGGTAAGGCVPLTRTYTITNTGTGTLDTTQPTPVTISGTDASDFTVTTQPGSAISANGGTSTFVITFTPTVAGLDTATVTIASDASNAPSFTFDIQGTALATTSLTGGLLYDTTAAGSGAVTQAGELLIMNYSGYLTNGTEFDSNTNAAFGHVTPFEFNLGAGSVIKGWDEGLVGAQAGESRTLIIPASLAYGAAGSGSVPPNATLIFTTTLLNVVSLDGVVNSSDVFIADGDTSISTTDGTDFGQVAASGPAVTHDFVINETPSGLSSLLASPAITLTGAGASSFSVAQPTISGNSTGTFTVTYTPSPGFSTATVTINNAAYGLPNLTFNVQGQEQGTGAIALTGNSAAISNGESSPSPSNFTDFGGTAAGGSVPLTRTYTITNTGTGALDTLQPTPVTISGADASDFSVTTQPAATIAASGTSTFEITFTPTAAAGLDTATVTIANDSSTPSFTFEIQGTALTTTTLAGGLQYDTTGAGSGAVTQAGDLLIMDYSGYLTDGTEFDSNTNPTFSHVYPFEFNLGAGSVIKGWDQGLVGMQAGESRTLIIPSSLGYGASGSGSIPPNATLIFTTKLLDFVSVDGVVSPNDVFIPDGDTSPSATDGTYFGHYTDLQPAVTHTFLVNESVGPLSSFLATPEITLAGAGASSFSVTQPTFNGGGTQGTFTVTYTPSPGITTATVTINNAASAQGDPNVTFDVQGQGEQEAAGAVTAANQTEITGWAYDPLNPTASINVQIDIAGGPAAQTISADQTLDSLQLLIGSTNHGFTYDTPILSAGNHAVSVYAIDTTTGDNVLIGTGTINYPVTPDDLTFTQQPSDTGAGDTIATLQVTAISPVTNATDTSFTGAVTIHLLEAGTLLGTKTATAVNGVATFSGLSVDTAGRNALVASAAGVDSTNSAAFDVASGVATHLAFIDQPTSFWQDSAMASPVVVASEDQFGNAASAGSGTQITLGVSSEPAGAVVSGTGTKTAVNGVASFAGLTASLQGNYVLIARSGSLTSATSNSFAVVPLMVSERFTFSGVPLSSAAIAFQQSRNSQGYAPTYAQALAVLVGDVAVSTAAPTFAASSSTALPASTASPFASGNSTSDSNLESQLLDGGSGDQPLLS